MFFCFLLYLCLCSCMAYVTLRSIYHLIPNRNVAGLLTFERPHYSAAIAPRSRLVHDSQSDRSSSFNSIFNQSTSRKVPLPLMNIKTIGIAGRWIEKSGNFILKPLLNESTSSAIKPYGVIHFLGGAFVGAAPHITYRYLLESLCQQGYVIVATPYRLEMDYTRSCDQILTKFDAIAVELAAGANCDVP